MLDGGRHVRYNVACGVTLYMLHIEYVLKFPCNRGGSGALYLQSAIAGVMVFQRGGCCRAALGKWC